MGKSLKATKDYVCVTCYDMSTLKPDDGKCLRSWFLCNLGGGFGVPLSGINVVMGNSNVAEIWELVPQN